MFKNKALLFVLLATVLSACLYPNNALADDWPHWMGPNRDGVWNETGILGKFPDAGPTVLWRTKLGQGHSGPAVVGNRVFVMDRNVDGGAFEDNKKKETKNNATPTNERGTVLLEIGSNPPAVKTIKRSFKTDPRNRSTLNTLMTTPLVKNGFSYSVANDTRDKGIFRCVEVESGEMKWTKTDWMTKEPLVFSTAFIVEHEDKNFVFNDIGELMIVKLTPEGFQEIDRAALIEPTGVTRGRAVVWCHPAFANGRMFVRNDKEIICVDLRESSLVGESKRALHPHEAEQDNAKLAKELKQLSDELQTALDAVVEADQLPGATLAISLPDGRQIALASGFEDVESQTPMPVNGAMLVGSTGKTYVSAVALQLVTEGKIKLDDLVGNHFADSDKTWFARIPNSEALTIRSLMNHTSGLPRYVFSKQFLADVRENPLKSRSPRECISVVLDMNPKHDVGNGWGYSDTNYLLLGMIIEKTTGNSFYDEAQRRLLTPLGLKTTIPTTQSRLPGLVQGYAGQPNPFGVPEKTIEDGNYALNPSFEWCGGGYMSNVGDLANWTQALHTGKVLGNEIYSELVSPVDFRTGKKSKQGYGLGAFVWQTELGEFVGHAGMMPGYLTQIEFSRTHHFSVAYQVNTDQGSSRTNHNHVVDFAKIVTKNLK